MRITVLGLGEAGSTYARSLSRSGHAVTGFDPAGVETPPGVRRSGTFENALSEAELVLAFVPATVSVQTAIQARAALARDSVYADFSAASPAQMEKAAAELTGSAAKFADVAILAPVPLKGAASELLVSGPGGKILAEVMKAQGSTVDVLDAPAGAASSYKLLRSIFMKGLAAVICETMDAAHAAGAEDWIRGQISQQLEQDGQAMIDRFLVGTQQHAERRSHEMSCEMSAAARQALIRKARLRASSAP
jgi:3-hydroxyisobutyrate dehydrogenase-like beta-hydroxyacid dehydrogenase